MNIQQITTNIDRQVLRIELQMAQLKSRLNEQPDNAEVAAQISQLDTLKNKLIKSKALAIETQALVGKDESQGRRQKRLFGLGLAITSSLGILFLVYLLIAS